MAELNEAESTKDTKKTKKEKVQNLPRFGGHRGRIFARVYLISQKCWKIR